MAYFDVSEEELRKIVLAKVSNGEVTSSQPFAPTSSDDVDEIISEILQKVSNMSNEIFNLRKRKRDCPK